VLVDREQGHDDHRHTVGQGRHGRPEAAVPHQRARLGQDIVLGPVALDVHVGRQRPEQVRVAGFAEGDERPHR
jgi:hypothetical protein